MITDANFLLNGLALDALLSLATIYLTVSLIIFSLLLTALLLASFSPARQPTTLNR